MTTPHEAATAGTTTRREAAIRAVHALEAGSPDPSVEEYVDAVLGVVAEREAQAEQRGREDNADHGMCYVSGSNALEARERAEAARALRAAVDEIERELICCDVFERRDLKAKHHICYWGGAAAKLVADRADALDPAGARAPERTDRG